MFTASHFIWLGSIALLIGAVFFLISKFRVPQAIVQKAVLYLLIATKIFHTALSMKDATGGGMVLDQSNMPFHLCSLMIYAVIIMNLVKNEQLVKVMKSFMVPSMLIGAAMALIIPTAGTDPATPRVWEYMSAHTVLVFYGIYLMAVEKVDLSFKVYLTNLKILAGITVFAFLMNSMLEPYEPNYLFLRKPPMDGLPILNLDHGWHVYFVILVAVACVLMLAVHLPFIIKAARRKNTDTDEK
jgi:hypothetical integral membrane protein (TIGR02206 family)